ncbi:NUDIX domain-containing protein [Streptomyces sp. NPDC057798]|uniref:NUDIX domain-containing protein n=1 Tax=Streptomyces sp. NPDC057798 TaxID=3346252 RepID=UPI0036BEFD93
MAEGPFPGRGGIRLLGARGDQHAVDVHDHAAVGGRTVRPDQLPEPLHIVGVHLHLQDDQGRILQGLRRPDSTYASDTWHFLAGHCERESAIQCLVREAMEEARGTVRSSGAKKAAIDLEIGRIDSMVAGRSTRPIDASEPRLKQPTM